MSNTTGGVWPHFKIWEECSMRRSAEYFWRTSKCLEMWSKRAKKLLNVWYIYSIETKNDEETKNKIVNYMICSWFLLFKLDELLLSTRISNLIFFSIRCTHAATETIFLFAFFCKLEYIYLAVNLISGPLTEICWMDLSFLLHEDTLLYHCHIYKYLS